MLTLQYSRLLVDVTPKAVENAYPLFNWKRRKPCRWSWTN